MTLPMTKRNGERKRIEHESVVLCGVECDRLAALVVASP